MSNMDINEMTIKQFKNLKLFEDQHETMEVEVDSIVLVPTKIHDDSGYNVFYVVACNNRQPVGICSGHDAFDIFIKSEYTRIGIDCLRGSGLMRIFLPTNEYVIKPYLHQIIKKRKGESISTNTKMQ